MIVVNKPKGLVVHPAPATRTGRWSTPCSTTAPAASPAWAGHCGPASSTGSTGTPPASSSRRRTTSPIRNLSAQLQDHTLSRIYRCIVVGNLREDSGTVDAPIGRHPTDRKKMAVVAGGRPAVTHWTVLERLPGFTYTECRLETGRTHQIRVHMAHIGHPILGTRCMGRKGRSPVSRASASTRWDCGSCTPRTGGAGGAVVRPAGGIPDPAAKAGAADADEIRRAETARRC